MRFLIQVITIIILAFLLELFLPWWSIALAALAAGIAVRSNANFLAGFLGIAILWLAKAWLIDSSAATPLIEKVARIFTLPNKSLLFLIMALLGGLVGGFAALTGSLLKKKS
jgi:hypothetical protein